MQSSPTIYSIFWLLAISAFFGYGERLKCYSCDDAKDCANPREKLCSENDECFTVAQNYDTKLNGLRKGCAPTCDRVNIEGMLCRTCASQLCNGRTGLGKAFEKSDALSPRRYYGHKKGTNGKKTYMLHLLLIVIYVTYYL